MAIAKFEDIETWKAAREVFQAIYHATAEPRFSRDYGSRERIQRASVSIMANIAEGFDSQSNQAFTDSSAIFGKVGGNLERGT